MTRTTSAKAFREETDNGNITKKQEQVYEWLMFHGPATGREISAAIPGGHKRLSDLKKKGQVRELPKVIDGATGKEVILWAYRKPQELDWATPDLFPPYKPTRKQLEAKLKETEMALERAQKALNAFPSAISRVYDKAYSQGRIDERNGVQEPDNG